MKVTWPLLGVLLVMPGPAASQTPDATPEALETTELYAKAIRALLGAPEEAGTFYLASRVRDDAGHLLPSPAPSAVSAELARAGYRVELAELAENGLWRVPRARLFLMLREIEWWPGRKIATFSIDVGAGAAEMIEEAFKFRKEEGQGWILIEKGPAESES